MLFFCHIQECAKTENQINVWQQLNFTLILTAQGFKLCSHYFKLSASLDRILCQIQMFYQRRI